MTDAWKRAVERRLDETGKSRKWLADELGVDKGAITRMLSAEQQSSAMVPRISEILELPMPLAEIMSTDEEKTLADFRLLAPDDKRDILKLIERLLRDRESSNDR